MSEQSTTTNANAPAEPVLCKMGCGFFGNNSTGGCCSKCFNGLQKKKSDTASASQTQATAMAMDTQSAPSLAPVPVSEPTPMEEDHPEPVEQAPALEPVPVADAKPEEKKRKKKKKTSYKSMMSNMTKRTSDEVDIEKEKESLRKVTGGGKFSKIDRI